MLRAEGQRAGGKPSECTAQETGPLPPAAGKQGQRGSALEGGCSRGQTRAHSRSWEATLPAVGRMGYQACGKHFGGGKKDRPQALEAMVQAYEEEKPMKELVQIKGWGCNCI